MSVKIIKSVPECEGNMSVSVSLSLSFGGIVEKDGRREGRRRGYGGEMERGKKGGSEEESSEGGQRTVCSY